MGARKAQTKPVRKSSGKRNYSVRRKPLGIKEFQFCDAIARGSNVRQACLELGINTQTGYDWYNEREATMKEIERLRARLRDKIVRENDKAAALRKEFLDEQTITRIQKEKKTTNAIVNLIIGGYKVVGAIQPNTVSSSSQSATVTQAIATVQNRAFVPRWRQEALKALESDGTTGNERQTEPAELRTGD